MFYLSLTLSTTNGSSTAVRPGIVIADTRPPVFQQIDFPAKDGLNRKWRMSTWPFWGCTVWGLVLLCEPSGDIMRVPLLPQVWLILFVAFVLLYRLIYLSTCHDPFNKPPAQTRQHGTAEKRKRKKEKRYRHITREITLTGDRSINLWHGQAPSSCASFCINSLVSVISENGEFEEQSRNHHRLFWCIPANVHKYDDHRHHFQLVTTTETTSMPSSPSPPSHSANSPRAQGLCEQGGGPGLSSTVPFFPRP